MLSPIEGQIHPSIGSGKLIQFNCDCGRTTWKPWKYFVSGHTKSCGKCNEMSTEFLKAAHFGELRMLNPTPILRGSNKRVEWVCSCGQIANISVVQVTTGNTKSCGKCSNLPISHWELTRYGKLRMADPKPYKPYSREKIDWVCDCGKITQAIIFNVTRGFTTSCGRCSILPASHFESTKYGKLRMKLPQEFHPGSEKVVNWICDCGKELDTKVAYVVKGDTTSCGKCHIKDSEHWKETQFGSLKLKDPKPTYEKSHTKPLWICTCGGENSITVGNVTQGKTTNCGNCYDRGISWYEKYKNLLQNLSVPISPDSIPAGWIQLQEPVAATRARTPALCGACKNSYTPMWDNVRLGRSITCGCGTNRVSMAQREIQKYIEGLGLETTLEYSVQGLHYDILVNQSKLLIEYNGLRWHSFEKSRYRDRRKYENAQDSGYEYVMIFEDEWIEKQSRVKSLLCNRLGKNEISEKIRPQKCEVRKIGLPEANSLYEKYHYIGKCKGSIHYGVFYKDELVGATSFGHPTRQSKHSWELIRMVGNPSFKIHGIWSKLLQKFIQDYSPNSIVSFSDNRLFSGGVYEKIGFRFDGEIPPDYYWVRGQKRFHKSGLRKKGIERDSNLTESAIREAQGFRKIWDLGKKRWVWDSPSKVQSVT